MEKGFIIKTRKLSAREVKKKLRDFIDDIIVRCDNACCTPAIGRNGQWLVRANSTGFTVVTLFSRHNDQVFAKFAIRVT